MYPDNDTDKYQGHRCQDHQSVVAVAPVIAYLRDNLYAEQGSGAQQFAEESHDNKYQAVAQSASDTVQQGGPGAVAQGKGFNAPHDNTVRDYQTHED